MNEIIRVSTSVLKPHPMNSEFFDDVQGKEFQLLVDSIRDNGVLTPLRVSKDMFIISGHQRFRACKEVGLLEVPVIISDSSSEDDVLIELIASNFGRMTNKPLEQARWITKYEELKGVRQGSAYVNQKAERQFVAQVSQSDIADELGIDRKTLQRLKSLLKLEPSIQELISNNKISASTGYTLISKLAPDEQMELIKLLPEDITTKITASKIKEYIDIIKNKDKEFETIIQERDDAIESLKEQLLSSTEANEKITLQLEEANKKIAESDTEEKDKTIEDLKAKVKTLEQKAQESIANSMRKQDKDEKRINDCFRDTMAYITQLIKGLEVQLSSNTEVYNIMDSDKRDKIDIYTKKSIKLINELREYIA